MAAAIVVRSAESLLFYDPLGCCCCCCCCWFCCCCCCSRRFSFRFFSPSDPSPLPTTKVRNQSCGRKINAADQKTTTTTTTTTIAKKKRQQKSQTRSFGFSFFLFFLLISRLVGSALPRFFFGIEPAAAFVIVAPTRTMCSLQIRRCDLLLQRTRRGGRFSSLLFFLLVSSGCLFFLRACVRVCVCVGGGVLAKRQQRRSLSSGGQISIGNERRCSSDSTL